MGLRSNQAIGAIKALGGEALGLGKNLMRPLTESYDFYKGAQLVPEAGYGVMDALRAGHSTGGKLDYGKVGKSIAGSYMSVSAGYRVASGGGVYRDSSGNSDLIGIPFL